MDQAGSQQRDLFESERSFRLLVEAVTDYALYMLDPGGRVSSWNIGAQRIKGYQPAEILGQHFSRFYTETDRANGKPARALMIAEQQGRYEEEGWRVRKDGTFFWASVVIDPIREDGKLVGFAKITRDITERRESQLRLEKMQQQLAESQKLDALGQLTGGVAHDFNNLLMVISGSVHFLKKSASNDPTVLRAISAIETASKRGATLTSQLLTFARRQSVNPQPIDLTERIRAVRDVLETGVGSAVTLGVQCRKRRLVGHRRHFRIRDRHGRSRSSMHATPCRREERSRWAPATSRLPRRRMPATMSPFAWRIPGSASLQTYRADIRPFFTTKSVGKGTGLGLSQVHGFAHQAGGTVRVEAQLGKGTAVTILLPRDRASPQAERQETMATGGSGTVLLVEDNPDVASVSASLLEQLRLYRPQGGGCRIRIMRDRA